MGFWKEIGKIGKVALPAVVGIATGGVGWAAAAGALANIDNGPEGMALGALGAGLGAHYGGIGGLFGSSFNPVVGMALGTTVGSVLGGGMGGNMYQMRKLMSMSPPGQNIGKTPEFLPPSVDFPTLKLEAIHKTREAFKQERVYEVIEEQMKPEPFHKHLNIYNRYHFPTIKDVLKKRARAHKRKEVA